ncbi:MAG: hypothetical protein BGO51_18820 [Rhodospirillales bacterium 69-11]|jgi:hypothetical protein|nr:MAG: hypothetical protein BGO51_18820 [Rhodospirillales bacterium 69-11]
MGQYYYIIDLDARGFPDPRKLGSGRKAWEQIANAASTPQALFVLLTCSNGRGGGDFIPRLGKGDERIIGCWAGHRIAVVGDYAEDGDFAAKPDEKISELYQRCRDGVYRDITVLVRPILARELGVCYAAHRWWLQELDGTRTQQGSWQLECDAKAPFSILPTEPEKGDAP